MITTLDYQFTCVLPWRAGNHFVLFNDADDFYAHLLTQIATARSAICIEMYLVDSGTITTRLLDALLQAAKRGVQVRFLIDAIGAARFTQADRQRLSGPQIELRVFNPISHKKWQFNLARDHRKIIVIDGKTAMTGGAGISDDFSQEVSRTRAWRDTIVCVSGPLVADWLHLFERIWAHYDAIHTRAWREKLRVALTQFQSFPSANPGLPQARVISSRGFGNNPILNSLIDAINRSEERVWLSTAYFYPSRRLVRALKLAASRGIDVALLLPGAHTDHPGVRYAGRSWYTTLLQANIRICEYQPRFLHQKAALADHWVSLGSCNFDRWNLRWNLEANLETNDPDFAEQVGAMLQQDFSAATAFTLEGWRSRAWSERVREYLWKLVGRFLELIRNH